jgi:hypothetical protein
MIVNGITGRCTDGQRLQILLRALQRELDATVNVVPLLKIDIFKQVTPTAPAAIEWPYISSPDNWGIAPSTGMRRLRRYSSIFVGIDEFPIPSTLPHVASPLVTQSLEIHLSGYPTYQEFWLVAAFSCYLSARKYRNANRTMAEFATNRGDVRTSDLGGCGQPSSFSSQCKSIPWLGDFDWAFARFHR